MLDVQWSAAGSGQFWIPKICGEPWQEEIGGRSNHDEKAWIWKVIKSDQKGPKGTKSDQKRPHRQAAAGCDWLPLAGRDLNGRSRLQSAPASSRLPQKWPRHERQSPIVWTRTSRQIWMSGGGGWLYIYIYIFFFLFFYCMNALTRWWFKKTLQNYQESSDKLMWKYMECT